MELSKQSSIALEKVSEHRKHIAAPSASLAVQSDSRSKALTDHREMSFLTPLGSMTRSTFYDEDLGEVLNLSGHGTWANTNLYEIIQDVVDVMSPLQTIAKGHEERVAALEAVQMTAQKQALAARVFPWKSLLRLQAVCGCWGGDFLAFKRVRTSGIDRILDRGDVEYFRS